eukprot:TRINITY_DN7582_c0_g1_i1.p1 TRINITY_DN7582_c0_g1~~TRINITY_DN7582_c0_g1_i1.p1  ORF type:complete len:467 (-),score=54.45 TRINITY_DN7582_c0_g1_i1:111-1511(-)
MDEFVVDLRRSLHDAVNGVSQSVNLMNLYNFVYDNVFKNHLLLKENIIQTVQNVMEYYFSRILVTMEEVDNQLELSSILNTAAIVDKHLQKVLHGRNWLTNMYPDLVGAASKIVKDLITTNEAIKQLLDMETIEDIKKTIDDRIKMIESKTSGPAMSKLFSIKTFKRSEFVITKNVLRRFTYKLPERHQTIRRKVVNVTNSKTGITTPIMILEDVLSDIECQEMIKESEKIGFLPLDTEFLKESRESDRVLMMSDQVSKVLWQRIKEEFINFMPNVETIKPFGFDSDGKWTPRYLNPCLRFCKYTSPSVGFLPHRDANYIKSSEERSIYTVLIYLNEGYHGGTTDILDSNTIPQMGETVDEEMSRSPGCSVLYSVVPKRGMVVIFNHTQLHRGSPLPINSGLKYVIRTDVVFHREEKDSSWIWQQDKSYLKMMSLYRSAGEAECLGNIKLSSELYERALSIRQNQS